MSTSIYSFINPNKLINSELKGYYDLIQVNEDKLHSKMSKITLERIKKLGGKESLTDKDFINEIVNNMRELKELV